MEDRGFHEKMSIFCVYFAQQGGRKVFLGRKINGGDLIENGDCGCRKMGLQGSNIFITQTVCVLKNVPRCARPSLKK